MRKFTALLAVLLLIVFVTPAFSRGGSSGGGFSSGGRSSFSSSSSRSSFSSSSYSTKGASSIKPSTASPIKPSTASPIRPSTVTSTPYRPAPRVYSYPTYNTTVVNRTYAYPVQPSVVYYREPSSGFGNFWINMWIYQSMFGHNDRRPEWNEQNGPRPVVKVQDPEKKESYEISNYKPPRSKMRFWDYVFIGLLIATPIGLGYGIYRLIKRYRARRKNV